MSNDNFENDLINDIETNEDVKGEDENKNIRTESEEVVSEIESLKNQLIRLQADFNNFRKRSQKRESESVELGIEKLAEVLFPVIDNFDIALSHIGDKAIYDGVKMIYDQLLEALKSKNIEVMVTNGERFDPSLHYAVMTEDKEGVQSGMVTETLKKGFMIGDKVIRPAMVKVSK